MCQIWVHPQQVCRWHQAEWCGRHAWGRNGMPSQGTWTSWRGSLCEPREVQQGQVQGPACGSGQPPVSIQAGDEGLETALPRRTWGCWWMWMCWTWPGHVCWQPRRPSMPWAASPAAWAPSEGAPPLSGILSLCPALLRSRPGSPAPSSGTLSTGQIWSCWCGAKGSPSNDPRAGTCRLGGKAGKAGAVQPGEEKAPGRPQSSLPVPEGCLEERWGQAF